MQQGVIIIVVTLKRTLIVSNTMQIHTYYIHWSLSLMLCLYFQGSSESEGLQFWSLKKIGPGSHYGKSPVS